MLLLQNQLLLVMELSFFEYGNNATYSFSEYTYGLAVNLKDSVSYQTKKFL